MATPSRERQLIDNVWQYQTVDESGGGGSPPFGSVLSSPLDISAPYPLQLNSGGSIGADGQLIVCDLWLDASDVDTITADAGKVSGWEDKSGAGNNAAQAVAENQPTTGADTIGGLNALTFDGASSFIDSLCIAYPVSLVPTAGDSTAFVTAVVYEAGAVDLDSFNYAVVGDDSIGNYVQLNNSASDPQLQTSAAATVPADPVGPRIAVWAAGVIQGQESEVIHFGLQQGSSLTDPTEDGSAVLRVGATSGPDRYWLGKIGEVIHYSGVLDPAQVQQLMAYLAAKWSITS